MQRPDCFPIRRRARDARSTNSRGFVATQPKNNQQPRGKPMFHRTAFAFAIWASAMTSCAFAETDAERQACMADAQIHCGDQIPDRERVYACLVQKVAQISVPCRKIINESIAASRPQRRK